MNASDIQYFVYESELQKELQPIWEASTDNCRYLSSHGV